MKVGTLSTSERVAKGAVVPIDLPDFRDRKCVEASFCGFFSSEKAATVAKQLKVQEKSMTARYRKSAFVWIGLILPFPWEKKSREGSRGHVHVVLAQRDRFTGPPPKTNAKAEDILALFEPFAGSEIDVTLLGRFHVPVSELPPFMASTIVEGVANNVEVRMTGGTLAVRGAPIHEIVWQLPEKGSPAVIFLEARTKATLDASYLENGLDLLESAFKAFIVGDHGDEEE